MQRAIVLSVLMFLCMHVVDAQDTLLLPGQVLEILKGKDALVDDVLAQSEKYRLQFVCTVVDGEQKNKMQTDRLLTGAYFYPASTVKLPIAFLTLEKLNRLGFSLDDRLVLNPDVQCGNTAYIQNTQPDGLTFRQMLEEMLVMSNNEHYSTLFHFLAPGEMFQRLSELGYSGVHIFRAFNGCELEAHLKTNSWKVIQDGKVVYTQDALVKPLDWLANMYHYDPTKLIGDQHEYRDEIRSGPFDFNYHLELPLEQLHQMMLRLMQPGLFPESMRWQLEPEQRKQIIDWMESFPSECCHGEFTNERKYPNSYNKFFLIGESNASEPRTISKIGLSYGFVTEVVYVPCTANRSLLFTVSMYVNENRIVNDGKYEYDEVAKPFLARAGKILHEYFSK